jgi:Tol biopolymer transport system component
MAKNLKTAIVVAILFLSFRGIAQKKDAINYPDQKHPGMTAQVFAPGIVSTAIIEHSAPSFSPDGKTVFWAIMKMPSYQTCLLEMNFINNKWSPAHSPSFSDTTANEVYPNFSPDGNTLYFSSDRNDNSTSATSNKLWYINKTANGWSHPKPMDTLVFKNTYASSMALSGNRYIAGGPQGNPDWNIYKTDHSGKSNPLPPHINTKGYEDGPYIAPDETYLIFESDRNNSGIENNIDLYISFRKKDSTWAEPANMGPKINSAYAERFAKVSPDGKYLFFGRNPGNGFDIYWISANIIGELKKQAIKNGVLD